jgi:hypothetical protein
LLTGVVDGTSGGATKAAAAAAEGDQEVIMCSQQQQQQLDREAWDLEKQQQQQQIAWLQQREQELRYDRSTGTSVDCSQRLPMHQVLIEASGPLRSSCGPDTFCSSMTGI